jgi:PhnB protein
MMMTYDQTPMKDQMPAAIKPQIAHARMMIGDQVLMASDAHTECQVDTKGMTISLLVDTPAEAERIFKALGDGGQVTMAMEETFWANRFGMLVDKFGIPWMVNCEKAAQQAA